MILIISMTPASDDLLKLFPLYENKTSELIEYNVHAVQARQFDALQTRLIDRRPINLKERLDKSPLDYDDYVALIKSYGDDWLLNDMRVLWFLGEFEKLTKVEKIIAIKQDGNNRYNEFLDSVLGKRKNVLVLDEDKIDLGKVEKWLNGEQTETRDNDN